LSSEKKILLPGVHRMTDNHHSFGTAALTASVKTVGAELCALADHTRHPYLWPATAAWPRHAPNLFPIVGRLAGDTLYHHGQSYRLTQHGFARDLPFKWIDRSPTGCVLALSDDEITRTKYPFAFRFEVAFAAHENCLTITYTVHNTGAEMLPASMGAHPAFRWPLQPDLPKEAYSLVFETAETAPLRSVADGLLTEANRPSPIKNGNLGLHDALFTDDALILPAPNSRWVHYTAERGPSLTLGWDGFSQLGLWSKPGADFLCIEPWQGMASPPDFDGEFADKPWLMLIAPGQKRSATMTMTLNGT
jgi:galactose mutarotase-like enzyme